MSSAAPELLHLHLQALEVGKPGLLAVSTDDNQWFLVPGNMQLLTKHAELMAIPKVVKAAAACTEPPKYRRIRVESTAKLAEIYLDEQGDLIIGGEYLEEADELRHNKLPKLPSRLQAASGNHAGDIQELIRLLLEQKMTD